MKCEFNLLRRNIAGAYNRLATYQTAPEEAEEACEELRTWLVALLSLQNPDDPHDSDDLSDEIKLLHAGEPQAWLKFK
jgi:hypothetical protein